MRQFGKCWTRGHRFRLRVKKAIRNLEGKGCRTVKVLGMSDNVPGTRQHSPHVGLKFGVSGLGLKG